MYKKIDIVKTAQLIETTLDSLGIKTRVTEVNHESEYIEFCIDIALGNSIDEIIRHKNDIAMAVASPTGEVTIIAPIPGKSLIGIRIPTNKTQQNNSDKPKSYRIIKVETEKVVYKGVIPQLKKALVSLLKLLVIGEYKLITILEKQDAAQ